MSRIIKTENGTAERNRLSRGIVLAIRELMQQSQPDEKSLDLASFIALSLLEIYNTIDKSAAAWEKRDYWIKADRFRREWEWTKVLGDSMHDAVLNQDWGTIAMNSVSIGQRLNRVKVGQRHRLGTPWVGAWKKLIK
ncbi:MAG: hypothetical protein HPY45_04080 [Anaerolineae bacterium]|nr:hypothetical protein [Anaerolineae bacterium]